jgi:solute:Na+ symporter, SSS family
VPWSLCFSSLSVPPLFFNPVEVEKVRHSAYADQYHSVEERYEAVAGRKAAAAREYIEARQQGNSELTGLAKAKLNSLSAETASIRKEGIDVLRSNDPRVDPNDTNYIFLSFVMKYLPIGLVGLIFACIFAASMSSTSGELSALATCSVVDVYKRHLKTGGEELHYLRASRLSMALWGVYAIIFAQYASRLGSLIEAVNILGSLFYGTMLAVFLIAFYLRWIGGTATFWAALVGEAVVLSCYAFTSIPWLWYNVIGCGVVAGVAMLLQLFQMKRPHQAIPAR